MERLADALGSALAEAHRAGVVHRDIKPGNVLFDADGVPHLADFGVASSRDDTAGLTVIGTVVGTPGFMAPEQARGEGAGQASDVFALGATLLYAATGEGPYGKGAAELLMVRAAQGKVRPIPRSLPRVAAPAAARRCSTRDPTSARRPPRWSAGRPAPRCAGRWRAPPSPLAGVGGRRRAGGRGARWPACVVSTSETGDAGPTTTVAHRRRPGCTDLPVPAVRRGGARAGHRRPALPRRVRGLRRGRRPTGARRPTTGSPTTPPFPEGADPIEGTIVPRDDVDTFAMAVGDGSQLLCDGRFTRADHRARRA